MRDQRDVGAGARHCGAPDRRDEVGVERDRALLLVDDEVLHDEDGVVIADGRLQQPLGVGRVRGRDDLESGGGGEPALEALRMLSGELVAGAVGRADDQWAAHLAAEHGSDLGCVIDDLVHRDEQEIEGHDLDHRALAEHRGADARADEPLLGDRGVAHAVGPELVEQAGGDLVGAAEDADLLAHDEDALIARELLAQRQADRLAVGHDLGFRGDGAHRPRPAVEDEFELTERAARPHALELLGATGRIHAGGQLLDARRFVSRGVGHGRVNALGDLALQRDQLVVGHALVDQAPSHQRDGVLSLPRVDLVSGAVAESCVGHRMAAIAVGHRFQDGRLALVSGAAQQAPRALGHGAVVVSIDALAVHAKRAGALVELGLGRGALDARAHAVLVVDNQEHDRQRPQRGEVERLVPGAHVHRAVAELAQHGLWLALTYQRKGEADGDGKLAGDDPPSTEEAAFDVEEVHRAAPAVSAAVTTAEELGHDRLGADATRERETVAAIAGDEEVVVLQRVHRADDHGLLTGRHMAIAADVIRLVLALGLGLERANEHHLLIGVAQQLRS